MITCHNCGKENQDHYKFCLGCGAELRRDKAAAKVTAPTPPSGFARPGQPAAGPAEAAAAPPTAAAAPSSAAQVAAVAAAAPPAAAAVPPVASQPQVAAESGQVSCPRCGTSNPITFKFCGSCGFDLQTWLAQQGQAEAAPVAPAPVAPAPVAPAPASASQDARGSLVRINPDGSEGERVPLAANGVAVGRSIPGFSEDGFLSPQHATLRFDGDTLVVRDDNSLNGVWYRIAAEEPQLLDDGAMFRIGQELIQFERIGDEDSGEVEVMGSPADRPIGRAKLVVGRDTTLNAYVVPATGLHLGRERGDVLFPEDGYVSGLHGRIHSEDGKVFLTDLGSSNGTYLRVQSEHRVPAGTFLLMGQQIFRADY